MTNPMKILVVDDSAYMRTIISQFIENTDDLTVVAKARNGTEAISMLNEYKPDVITMDIVMPDINGIEVVRKIMSIRPTPIIMVSSLTVEGSPIVLKALEAGAVDFLLKPGGQVTTDFHLVKDALLEKIRLAKYANLNILSKVTEKPLIKKFVSSEPYPYCPFSQKAKISAVICIGVSTGGPSTVQLLLQQFPRDLNAGYLICQHMPASFTNQFSITLDNKCQIDVIEGKIGQQVKSGSAILAPGDYNLSVGSVGAIRLARDSRGTEFSPNIDIMMSSAAKAYKEKCIGVLLTGMGKDGVEGLRAIQEAGGTTYAQNEESCILYGMPKAAKEAGVVDKMLSPEEIAHSIIRKLSDK